jgi:hypothetical protein
MRPSTRWLRLSLRLWKRRLRYRTRRLKAAKRAGVPKRVVHWERLVNDAAKKVGRRREQLAARRTLGTRALSEAKRLVGVMEEGGNNAGARVARIIRSGGGTPSDRPPWCGYFVAHCYKTAGSTAMDWQAGAVRLWLGLSGVRRTTRPRPGDPVRFTFDHIGMFVKDNGDGTITTIEGNTGATGAVSDSRTGGDGVYRKIRPKSQVADYLRVSR